MHCLPNLQIQTSKYPNVVRHVSVELKLIVVIIINYHNNYIESHILHPLSTAAVDSFEFIRLNLTAFVEMVLLEFRLKRISFFHRELVVICQNENGPCPLLAIANVLLLRGSLSISVDRSYISSDEVEQLVGEALLDVCTRHDDADYNVDNDETKESMGNENDNGIGEHRRGLHSQHFEDVAAILPKLSVGLDLNVRFDGVNRYEFTREITIFDALQISLVHGWLCDCDEDGDVGAAAALQDQSYNLAVNDLVAYRSLLEKLQDNSFPFLPSAVSAPPALHADTTGPADAAARALSEAETALLQKGPHIEAFLTRTASQLTERGIFALHDFLADRQFAVFFRNNHFATLFYLNGQLLLLLTDLGFADQQAVWEVLVDVGG
jgi:ubiquitin carboxyl-terminal hydrolase MINDY-1/2